MKDNKEEINMLKLVINTISKELGRRKEVNYLSEQRRRLWRHADEQKEKAIEAHRNEKHAVGKMYMTNYDKTLDEILKLQDEIDRLSKE